MKKELENVLDPGGSGNTPNTTTPQQDQNRSEGEYKNIETSVNNRDYFGEDFSVEQENEMSNEEAATEDENDRG